MLSKRLAQLRKEKKLKQVEMADKIGVARTTYAMYEQGRRNPDYDTLQKLSDFFNVTIDYLIGKTDNHKESKTSDRVTEVPPPQNFLRIPVLGHIPAGKPILAQEHIDEFTDIPNPGNYSPDELIMFKVKGDSMINSRIQEGDKVLVKLQPEVENGQIAVVNINGYEATLKRVKKLETGQTLLVPANDDYDPILVDDDNARIVGKVIQVIFEP